MKTCIRCKEEKSLTEFYKTKVNADGYENSCKECVKSYKRKYRQENIELLRKRDRERYSSQRRAEWIKQYISSERGKTVRRNAVRASKQRYPHAKISRLLTWFFIKNGDIKQETECSECKSKENIQAHHDDYTKPKDIRWLCVKCHSEWHRHNKPIYGDGDGIYSV